MDRILPGSRRGVLALMLASVVLGACSSEITGTFGSDYRSTFDRCFWVETDDGERYAWYNPPPGWLGSSEEGTMEQQEGAGQLRAGDRIVVRGSIHDEPFAEPTPCSERGDRWIRVESISVQE